MIRRIISIWLSLAMVICSIIIVDVIKDYTPTVLGGTTRYVNETGTGAYDNIQDAINDSSNGDTIFVYSGTYYENVIVNKSINLTGENRDTTIIDGGGSGVVVKIIVNWVNFTSFTIANCGSNWGDSCIKLDSVLNCKITNNKMTLTNSHGIYLSYSSYNDVIQNTATSNVNVGISLYYSNWNNISQNYLSNNLQGIRVDNSHNNNITDNTVDSNDAQGMYIINSNKNIIEDNQATNHDSNDGIYVQRSSGNNVTGNTASSNGVGIELWEASGNNVTDNTASSNNWEGISITTNSDNNYIFGNIVPGNRWGIRIAGSNGNIIIANSVSSSIIHGIHISSSTECNLTTNVMTNDGIYIQGGLVEHWNTHDIDTTNTVNGKPVYYWKNQNHGTVPMGAGQVILGNCSNVRIESQSIVNGAVGVELGFSSDNIVHNNTVSSNSYIGIYMEYSSENNITENIISNNHYGNFILRSNNNNFSENTISSSGQYGFYFWYSNENEVTGNTLTSNSWDGIRLWYSDFNNLIGNHASGNAGGFYLEDSDDNYVISNYVTFNSGTGIRIDDSYDNNLLENTLTSNGGRAIYITSSSRNNIIKNHISDNGDYAVAIGGTSPSNNKIYHNNIINNAKQALDITNMANQWDNGYPCGGNYWSDYGGVDNYKGPGQNILGRDGIGDTAYVIDTNSKDGFPLMEPVQNYTILNHGWNLISLPLIQENHNLIKVLEMIDGYYDTVEWYNISDVHDPWKIYNVNKPFENDLTKINETMGFWIYITPPKGVVLLHNGTQPTVNQTITLHPGWNLVGYSSLTNYIRTEGLNNLTLGNHVNSIWTFNATTQKWKELGQSDYFELGRGYWVHAMVECEWEVPL